MRAPSTSPSPLRRRRVRLGLLAAALAMVAASGCARGGDRDLALETGPPPDGVAAATETIAPRERITPATRMLPRATVPTRAPITTVGGPRGDSAGAPLPGVSTTGVGDGNVDGSPAGPPAPDPAATATTATPTVAVPTTGETTAPPPPSTTSTSAAPATTTTLSTTTTLPTVALATRTRAGVAVLVDGNDHALYVSMNDLLGTGGACLAPCTSQWAPLSATVSARTPGVDATLLGTVIRPDGVVQLTYRGHPLYRLVGEAAGTAAGQGRDGVWYLIDAAGTPVTG